MVPLILNEVRYLLRTECCAQSGAAPFFVIEFRNKDMILASSHPTVGEKGLAEQEKAG
jgi:hypothetical protein